MAAWQLLKDHSLGVLEEEEGHAAPALVAFAVPPSGPRRGAGVVLVCSKASTATCDQHHMLAHATFRLQGLVKQTTQIRRPNLRPCLLALLHQRLGAPTRL